MAEPPLLAVDPGHKKCGLAVVGAAGVLERAIVAPAELPGVLEVWRRRHGLVRAVVGDGTQSRPILAVVEGVLGPGAAELRDETGSSLAGRRRYWREHPPRGLWRLVPTSLRVPPEPFDDWVAVILAERELAA